MPGTPHVLYAYQLRRWFTWCNTNELGPMAEVQRAHVELYIRHLHESGLMDSSMNTMMHAVRGYFRSAHIDGPSRPTRPSTPDLLVGKPDSPGPNPVTYYDTSALERTPMSPSSKKGFMTGLDMLDRLVRIVTVDAYDTYEQVSACHTAVGPADAKR